MSKFGVLVMGPAGAGKTTFSNSLIQHLQSTRRSCFYVNLDPAAENFTYQPDLDIRELITLEDVMEELGLGPNGGLIYCFEFLLQNLEFLSESPRPIKRRIPHHLRHARVPLNINLCAAYLLESTFVIDKAKFFAGTLSAMSAMLMLEIPHVNILSKMDQVKDMVSRREFRRFANVDIQLLQNDEEDPAVTADPMAKDALMSGGSFKQLNRAVGQLIDDFSMVSFLQLDVSDEDSVSGILSHIDDAIQYHEAQEPREPKDEQEVNYEEE
ncbi:GPN-loop GTPase 3 [Penicillium cosmopolitanum]|uniref:GPN-loop GTPase 3 n=1 Tax=Penicillium cosmopolitanum TaxID=1131564 RepID=A0A9W9SJ72_9EURO|nr:GPN-loop GTPase 3 [Penicillium cosmopolitanum]KAJ5378945.1 GPN-loop GTPase 3 [Penicillium cosmopolitanum]